MANNYFDTGDYTAMTAHTLARVSGPKAVYAAIEAGFDLLPDRRVLNENRVTFVASDTGAADAHVVALPETAIAYNDGLALTFRPVATSLTTSPTINVDSIGVKNIKTFAGGAPAIGAVVINTPLTLVYDATAGYFRIQSPIVSGVLTATGVTAGAYGSATAISTFTVDGNGVLSAAANVTITGLTVAMGGTGAASLTDGGILLGSGADAITAMAALADGSIVVGDGATDPVALAAFTSSTGTLKHESGGIEADISAIADGGMLVGTGAGTMAIRASALTAGAAGFLKHEVGGLEFDASAVADGDVVVGTGAGTMGLESGATFRATAGLGTGDSPQFTGINVGHATDTTITRTSAGLIAVEGNNVLMQSVDATLGAGFDTTVVADGTKTTGTYTPVYTGGNRKSIVHGAGAFTLAPQATSGSIVVTMTNASASGAITTSGFDTVSGDTIDNTGTNRFKMFLNVDGTFSHLHVVAAGDNA